MPVGLGTEYNFLHGLQGVRHGRHIGAFSGFSLDQRSIKGSRTAWRGVSEPVGGPCAAILVPNPKDSDLYLKIRRAQALSRSKRRLRVVDGLTPQAAAQRIADSVRNAALVRGYPHQKAAEPTAVRT